MNMIASTLVAGALATIVLATMVRGGSALGLTRIDLAFCSARLSLKTAGARPALGSRVAPIAYGAIVGALVEP